MATSGIGVDTVKAAFALCSIRHIVNTSIPMSQGALTHLGVGRIADPDTPALADFSVRTPALPPDPLSTPAPRP